MVTNLTIYFEQCLLNGEYGACENESFHPGLPWSQKFSRLPYFHFFIENPLSHFPNGSPLTTGGDDKTVCHARDCSSGVYLFFMADESPQRTTGIDDSCVFG